MGIIFSHTPLSTHIDGSRFIGIPFIPLVEPYNKRYLIYPITLNRVMRGWEKIKIVIFCYIHPIFSPKWYAWIHPQCQNATFANLPPPHTPYPCNPLGLWDLWEPRTLPPVAPSHLFNCHMLNDTAHPFDCQEQSTMNPV
jgi:hypothetical protein